MKRLLKVILLLTLIVLSVSTSYSLWHYTFEGNMNLIQNHDIEIEFLESHDVIDITNAIPISDDEGIYQESFDFQIKTKTKLDTTIGYAIYLNKLEVETVQLNDNEVKVYLTDFNNNALIHPTLISELDNYIIYKKYHDHDNVNDEIVNKYKLRVWIDENVTGEGWYENTEIAYSFKLGVKSLDTESYNVLFHSNNGMDQTRLQAIGYNEEVELEKNQFIKEGYRFLGWSTSEGGPVEYRDREKVINLAEKNESLNLYAVWDVGVFNVNVVVQNGVIEDSVSKKVNYNKEETFKLKPNSLDAPAVVSCTNNQIGNVKYNKLTVSNVTSDTVCTVVYSKDMTTLYSDGTLIINEFARDRVNNIEKHGTVTKEYEAMSESNSYVMTSKANQPWVNESTLITHVELGQRISPISTAYWFYEITNMETGDFTKLDTSDVIDMQYMFHHAGYNPSTYNLIGLNTWDVSKVTNMNRTFNRMGNKAQSVTLDLSNWDVSNVTDMEVMFNELGRYATKLNIIGLSDWDTSKVVKMNRMFSYAGNSATDWNIGDLSSWNTSKVTNMSQMFAYAGRKSTEWNIGDLSKWNVSNVTDMSLMFGYAGEQSTKYSIGNLSSWNTSKVTNMSQMFFASFPHVSTFDLGNIGKWNVSSVTNMSQMFYQAGSNSVEWNIGDLSSWNTSKVTNMNQMFIEAGMKASTFNLGDIGKWNVSSVTNMEKMFHTAGRYATSWSIGDLSNWNVSKVANMSQMFFTAGENSTTWAIGDLSNWNVSNITTMQKMFERAGMKANSFNLGNIGKWNVSKVTNMEKMFSLSGHYSNEWYIGDLSSWDTSKVTTMSRMFLGAGQGTSKNIGTLSIPSGCNVANFLYYNGGTGSLYANGNMSFNLIINGTLSSYTEMLRSAATSSSARINLYYKNAASEAIVDELISLYGPNGTVSKGNIYKVAS